VANKEIELTLSLIIWVFDQKFAPGCCLEEDDGGIPYAEAPPMAALEPISKLGGLELCAVAG